MSKNLLPVLAILTAMSGSMLVAQNSMPADTGLAHLPPGIRSRLVPNVNGLTMHVLEAGFESAGRPCVLLLHGFPELAYSWRKIMVPLAVEGYHVVAPDQRGYGRTTGWDANYDGDLHAFGMLNLVRDQLSLVAALGHRSVAAVIGHDYGSHVAGWCGLIRPDVFRSVAMMSAPFTGAPALAFDPARGDPKSSAAATRAAPDIQADLAALPRPRKHYHGYYSTRAANADMRDCPQGLHAFLRAYYHHKSADWPQNQPFPLTAWTATELAKLPTYYVMDLARNMAETVAAEMPSPAAIAACTWLPDTELAVYAAEYRRTGFQGGLQWYRARTTGIATAELTLYAGRTLDVPTCFISGASDWGNHQVPGAIEKMQTTVCRRMIGTHLIDGAGHWVQQERPREVTHFLIQFLRDGKEANQKP